MASVRWMCWGILFFARAAGIVHTRIALHHQEDPVISRLRLFQRALGLGPTDVDVLQSAGKDDLRPECNYG